MARFRTFLVWLFLFLLVLLAYFSLGVGDPALTRVSEEVFWSAVRAFQIESVRPRPGSLLEVRLRGGTCYKTRVASLPDAMTSLAEQGVPLASQSPCARAPITASPTFLFACVVALVLVVASGSAATTPPAIM